MRAEVIKFVDRFLGNKVYLILVTFLFLYLVDFNQTQSSAWISPYLSAAANVDWSNIMTMYVDQNQIEEFSKLNLAEKFNFNFLASENLNEYNYLPLGFYFIAIIATKVFFFIGDLEAIQLLQQIVHISLSLMIINKISKNGYKTLFFILYMINPIILYFVNFPYYYFWQVIPSTIFLYYFLTNKKVGNTIFIISGIFSMLYLIRPTILFFVIFIILYLGYKENWKRSILSLLMFFTIISIFPKQGFGPWHTIYVGIGGYANSYNIKLSDESGYKYFEEYTGKIYNSSKVSNEIIKEEYYSVIKEKYFKILQESPSLIIENTMKNILGSYGFGYKTGNSVLILTNIILGFIFIFLLLYTKQYLLFFVIGISSITFTPYYPPIGAYMYGSYILIVYGFIKSLEYILLKRNRKND